MILGRGHLRRTRGRDGHCFDQGGRRGRDYGRSGKLGSMERGAHAAAVGGATVFPGVQHRVHKQHEAPRQGEYSQPRPPSCEPIYEHTAGGGR